MSTNKESESRAQEQVKFMAELIKHVTQPMIITAADRHLLCWNEAFAKLTGYRTKELSDPIIAAGLTAPEWHESEARALERLQQTGNSQTFQKEYIRKDGSRVSVEVIIYKFTEGNGNSQYYVGLISDITERKRLEEELQKSENHYRILVENAIEGIVVLEAQKIRFVNPVVALVTGYSTEELQAMTLKDLLSPDNERTAVQSASKLVAPGSILVIPVLKIRTKAGQIRLIESTVVSITWDGKPANLNLIRDITERYQVEEAIRQSEKKYRSILEDIREGYWEVDLAGNFVSYNNAISRLVGLSQDELRGQNYRTYTAAEDVDKVYEGFNQVYRTGKPVRNMQYKIVHKDGSQRFAETSVFPQKDDKGKTIGFRGVSHDITERKQIEETLRQSQERYQALFDRSPDFVYLHDLEGNFMDANDKALELLGYDRKDIQNLNFANLLSEDQLPKAFTTLQEIIKTGTQRQPLEFRLRRKDGSLIDVETTESAIYRGEEIYAIQGIARDLTERRRLQERFEKERQELGLILDHSPVLVFYKDKEGKFVRVNKAFADALRMPEQDFIGKTVFDLYSANIAQSMTDDDREVIESGKPKLNIVEQYESADGLRWVQTDKIPIFDIGGLPLGLVGFAQDITEHKQTEEALKQSEEKYRSVLEQLEEAYSEVDLAGNFTFFNNALCTHLGYSREELLGMNYKVYTAPDVVDKVFQAYNQAYRTGEPIKLLAIDEIKKDGTRMTAEISVSPIRNEAGKITGFRQISRDVTERMNIEEALRRSEEKYRTILDEMEEGYYETDLEGNYTFFNDAIFSKLGYSREEFMGMNYQAHTAPEDTIKISDAYLEVFRTGKPLKWFSPAQIRKDGKRIFAEDWVSLLRNDKGDVVGFRGISRNITERKQMEEAIRRSEERYRTIMDEMHDDYFEVDLAGNYIFVNDALCRSVGYTAEELTGANYRITYHSEEDIKNIYKAFNHIYRTGEPLKCLTTTFTRKDESSGTGELSAFPVRNKQGEVTGFRGVSHDITERKQMEEALRKSEEKYRTILEDMQESYYENDLRGTLTFVNNAMCRHLGYSKEELMGMNYKVYTAPEEVEKVTKIYNQVHRMGKPTEMFVAKHIKKDGTIMIDEVSALPIRNESGDIIGFRGISREVTKRLQMEEALRQSEERYRTILNEMQDNYFEVDLAGHYTYVNDTLCQGLKTTRDKLIGESFKFSSNEDDAKKLYKAFHQTYLTGEPTRSLIYTFVGKDGSSGFGELSAFPIRNEKGQITGFRGVSKDVTERKRMEEALRQSEKRYRTILEEMQESYFETDLKGNYTLFNDAQCRQVGYTREEMTDMSYKNITPADRQKEVFEIYNQIYRTGEPNQLFQAEQLKKDGSRIPVEYSAFPVKNDKGEVIGFRGVGRDISKRLQMEETIRRSEERYRTVLEEMEEPYYEMDIAGRFTFFNDAMCRRLGYSREELMGMHYMKYTPPEEAEKAREQFNRVYRTGETVRLLERRSIKKDGSLNLSETTVLPLRNRSGEIIGFRGINRDLSERKKADDEKKQLEQKAQLASRLASVGELASGVAHEINNPLTGVIGYAHLLLTRKDLSKDVRHDLEIINEGSQRVAGIVKKLLAFARQTKPEQRYVNINELIRNTLDLRAYELSANNIKVTLQLARDIPMTMADPGQLQQVFLNLIINAETEMKQAHDKGKLTIKTERMDGTLRITFKDTGPGIAKENLETIFDPFYTTREVGQGTGLGLSVCHGIITEHNGKIWAESEPGKGASFIIEIPLITEEMQIDASEAVIEEPVKVAKAKILVVDDEPVIRQFISQVLGEQGHTVETVDNAAAALKMVKAKRYRLILLDIKMPGMSGVELYKQFQKIAPSITKRVVFITGDVMGKRTISFLNKTKSPYMMKPFDARELRSVINRILAKK
ncbi:MAG TPA: PAS domain S-box protein [Dehalococcoidia bacterium]|jgi:PAS domain S-box-containing protein